MRLRAQGQEVLLAVTIKPFLSHRREDAQDVTELRDTLKIYGAGGWKDTEDLSLGERTPDGIRRAIFEDTGGFIWWGTPLILESSFVNDVEIPAAFERKATDSGYPIVPLFVRLDPAINRDAIHSAIRARAGDLLECNGLIRREGQSVEEFCRRVAMRYVADAVKTIPRRRRDRHILVGIRALSEPAGEHDLTFDWRHLVDARSRTLALGGEQKIADALGTVREALQGAFATPDVLLDLDLPLPLAFLVGYEWRITTRLQLSVLQRTGVEFAEIQGGGDTAEVPEAVRASLGGAGPAVVAVSCRDGLEEVGTNYAVALGARELISLHHPGLLDAAAVRGLARATARVLRELNNQGVEKHLIMLGPETLAVFAGAAANASGPVTVPFWDGTRYVSPVIVGT